MGEVPPIDGDLSECYGCKMVGAIMHFGVGLLGARAAMRPYTRTIINRTSFSAHLTPAAMTNLQRSIAVCAFAVMSVTGLARSYNIFWLNKDYDETHRPVYSMDFIKSELKTVQSDLAKVGSPAEVWAGVKEDYSLAKERRKKPSGGE